MKITSLFLVILTIFSVSVFFWLRKENHCIVSSSRGDWIFEVARTREEHMRGLMNRTNMCDRCGMLFMFDTESPQVFWMKNTYLPLDMYFYDAQWMLVDVARNMRPEGETGEPMIYKSKPAQYVVEVLQWSIFPTDSVDILQCR